MPREYFNAYHSYKESMSSLNDAERGRLFTACLEYSATGELPELRGNERFVFDGIKAQIDRDNERYAEKCEKNRVISQSRFTNDIERHRTTSNDIHEKDKKKEKKKAKETIINPADYMTNPLEKAIDDFKDFRNWIKKPMTPRAVELLRENLNKLAKSDAEKIAILEQSILQGWQGIFPLKSDAKKKSSNAFFDLVESGELDE